MYLSIDAASQRCSLLHYEYLYTQREIVIFSKEFLEIRKTLRISGLLLLLLS